MSKQKFTPADCKALALAAFLFYAERECQVELFRNQSDVNWYLRVTREDTIELERCPLLDWPFIISNEVRVGYADIVTTWTIPV